MEKGMEIENLEHVLPAKLGPSKWGLCKKMTMGDECGCQEFEACHLDPLLCGCCDCHKHYHVRMSSAVVEFGVCQKKLQGQLCGCQSFLASPVNEKICLCCNHHQNFHKKQPVIISPAVCSQTESNGIIDLSSLTSPLQDSQKRRPAVEDCSDAQGEGQQKALKRVKLEFPEKEGLHEKDELQTASNILESSILKAKCDKSMPSRLSKNWKEMEEDPFFGFKVRGPYYPRISSKSKSLGKWVMYCVPCQDERSINPSFNLSNLKVHLSLKVNGVDSAHEKNLKVYFDKCANVEKESQQQKEKDNALLKRKEAWVQNWASQGAEFIDKNSWRCTICNFKGTFGVVDTVGQHMRGSAHILAMKNKIAVGGSSNQLTIQASLAKGISTGKTEYPPLYVPQPIDIPRDKLNLYCVQNVCHGFHNYFLKMGDDVVDVRPLLHDLKNGKFWYADPHYKRNIMNLKGENVHIEGTFRHVECDLIFCDKCSMIPSFIDFRMRAKRLKTMVVPRGERVCESGVRMEILQKNELIETARKWERRCQLANDQVFLLNVALTRSKKTKDYFSVKLQTALAEGSLPEIVELFRRAFDVGAFTSRPVLLNLLTDIVKNLLSMHKASGKGNGKRYHSSNIKLFEVLQNFGGSATHNFLSKNLEGPVLNTTRSKFRKEGFLYSIGINEGTFTHIASVLKSCKQKLGISGPIPFECSEDETKCIELAIWNRRLDVIDGFCGFKESAEHPDHECSFNLQPSSSTWSSISNAFENLQVGSMCRVLVANPLVAGMPRLVYCLLSTCNKFKHVQVQKQWQLIQKYHKKHLERDVGPLRGHASDGDSRRRKLMLESISRGTYGLKSNGFLMCAEIVDDAPLIMMQDPLHVGKKLRNPLLSAARVLFWGKYIASKNHLLLVYRYFSKEQHGLLEDDINVKDKQNFPAVQRISFPKVRKCLEELDKGIIVEGERIQEHVKGTILHLEVIWSFLEIFYGRGTLLEKVKLSSFVVHMIYFGTEYIRHVKHGHFLKDNWLTRESIIDCLISCHSAILYIMMMRDLFPKLPVALDKVGSDCCEDFFSLLGQHVKNKHNFCIGEAIERTSHIGRTEQIRFDEDGPLFMESRRRKNIWWDGNRSCCSANLADYESVSNEALQEAWLNGFDEAQIRAMDVGMKDVVSAAGKWTEPWPSSFSESLNTVEECAIEVDDETSEVVINNVQVNESNSEISTSIDDSLINEVDVLMRSSVLDIEQQSQMNGSSSNLKDNEVCIVSPVVDVPEKGPVFKMRLITELNAHSPSKLPLDRLRRVQYKNSAENSSLLGADEEVEEVGLFDDVAIIMEEGKKLTWYLARIQKIVKRLDKGGLIDYVRPVCLNEEGIKILPKYYKQIEGLYYSYGGYSGHEADFVDLNHIICLIALKRSADSEEFLLAQEDKSSLDNHLKNEKMRRSNCRRRSTNVGTLLQPQGVTTSTATEIPASRATTTVIQASRAAALVIQPSRAAPSMESTPMSQAYVTRSGRLATRFVQS